MMLNSTAHEDKCRKCSGDGSSCKTVSGLLDMNNMQVGKVLYLKITVNCLY